jgi:hypothetical protein
MTTNSQEANTQTTQRIRTAEMKSKIGEFAKGDKTEGK